MVPELSLVAAKLIPLPLDIIISAPGTMSAVVSSLPVDEIDILSVFAPPFALVKNESFPAKFPSLVLAANPLIPAQAVVWELLL